jgi:hypothetical protein
MAEDGAHTEPQSYDVTTKASITKMNFRSIIKYPYIQLYKVGLFTLNIPTPVTINTVIFSDITPCSLVEVSEDPFAFIIRLVR